MVIKNELCSFLITHTTIYASELPTPPIFLRRYIISMVEGNDSVSVEGDVQKMISPFFEHPHHPWVA